MRWLILKIRDGLNRMINGFTLRRKRVACGQSVQIHGIIKIYGSGEIRIGTGTQINSARSANPLGGDDRTVLSVAHGGSIVIGQGAGISNTAIVSHCGVVIEDNVRIGGSTKIYDTDFHSLDYKERCGQKEEKVVSRPVKIEEGAFVGAHCIILKGVVIGRHSIIGAGSVVTKSVPPGEIWAGNPARFIRRIEEEG